MIGSKRPASRPVSDDEIQSIAAEWGAYTPVWMPFLAPKGLEEKPLELPRLHFNVRRQLLFKRRPSECQEASWAQRLSPEA